MVFTQTINCSFAAFDTRAFKPEGTLNAAVFDSTMVGIARRLENGPIIDTAGLAKAYSALLEKPAYRNTLFRATSDEANVETRLAEATKAVAEIA
jgi:hypothetical protein